jgi:O-antigen ligase
MLVNALPLLTASEQARQTQRAQLLWIGAMAVLSVVCVVIMRGMGVEISPSIIAWIIYLTGAVTILRQPRYGIYLIVFFGLLADKSLMLWYPFTANFSSLESLLYLDKAINISPLELYLGLTFLSWLARGVARRNLHFRAGKLLIPALIWIAFMAFGFVNGVVHGGDIKIGLWECRAMFYLPAMLLLTTNLIETRTQINRLIWLAMIALFLMGGVLGLSYFVFVLHGQASRIESIVEHAAAIRMNTLFIMTISAWLFHASRAKRILLPLFVPFVFVTYMVAQRRAAFISLALGLVCIGILLYILNRKWFWRIVPAAVLLGMLYTGAFWNNQGTLGLPARTIRSIVASDAGNAQENSSNVYRVIENINNMFTIKMSPLTGVGFGHVFYMIAQLPDISFFAWWQYIVHNSILYIWMKTGLGGFASMLFMIGTTLIVGVRVVLNMPGKDSSAIALTALLYVLMHFVYAYVDMSWDNQSMMYLGTMMGLLNILEAVVARPEPPLPGTFVRKPVGAPV